ncbi:MAG: HEAT repeat domain-containing protein [Verrucomicrobiota bacterium]
MKHVIIILLSLANATFAQVIETNLETGVILMPVKDAATHDMLRASLREKDPLIRIQGLVALQTICDPADVELIRKLANDPVATVREQALNKPSAITAKAIEEPTNPDQIRYDLTNKSPLKQQLAADAAAKLKLTGLADDLIPLLDSTDSVLRRHVCEALGALRVEMSVALARQLGRDDDPFVRRAAADALLSIHSDTARDALVELLKHPSAPVRTESARALGGWKQPAVAIALHPLLLDVNPLVARATADAVGKLGNPDSRQPMLDAVSKCPPFAQARVAWALGELPATAAVPVLIGLLGTSNEETQSNAAEALGKLGDKQAIAPLQKVLFEMKAHGPTTRQRAIESLRLLGDRDSTKRVMQIITEKVVPPSPPATEPMYDMDDTRAEGVRYLKFIGDVTLADQMIKKLIDMPSYQLRKVMAGLLSQLKGTPYMAEFSIDTRHYLIESLGGEFSPKQPTTPGIVIGP